MKRLTTLLVLSIIILGSAFAQNNSKHSQAVFIKTSTPGVYKLIVDSEVGGNTFFHVYDEKGRKVFSDKIHKKKGFARNYNFEDIPKGLYKLEVEKDGKILSQTLEHESWFRLRKKPSLLVDLNRVAGTDKVDLKVHGANSRKVQVRIKDAAGRVLYTDRITGLRGFTRTYDIAKIGNIVAFEIEVDDNIYLENL